MHLIQFLRKETKYSYVPVTLSLLLTAYTCYLYIRNGKNRTLSNIFAFIASLIELLSSIVLAKLTPGDFNTGPILFTFSSCSVFLIIWSSFHFLLVKNREGPKSVKFFLLWFGYGWMFTAFVIGLSFTIILNDNGYFSSPPSTIWDDHLTDAIFKLSHWMFIVMIWMALIMVYRSVSQDIRFLMNMFLGLITTSAVYSTFDMAFVSHVPTPEAVTYLFGNLPVYLAIAIGANICSCGRVKMDIQDVELGRVTTPSYHIDDNDSQMTLTEDKKNTKKNEMVEK